MRALLILLVLFAAPVRGDDLDTLAAWMTGSFSSEKQSKAGRDYLDIRLEMVPIWTDRDDGPWLYVEQAAATNLEQPYRQRVYQLSANEDGAFESKIFTLPEPLRFAGAWRRPSAFAELEPADLFLRLGCEVVLRFNEDRFVGKTVGNGCSSELRGARYATSEVGVSASALISWDRGYDENDKQVWGAEMGPYLFARVD